MRAFRGSLVVMLICAAWLSGAGNVSSASDTLASVSKTVRYREGTFHGFLVLSTLEGDRIADGDMIQSIRGERITNRLTFHFKDGSLQDETTVFTQRGNFRLVSYHLVQKGPTFPRLLDFSILTDTGKVTVQTTDDKGQERVITQKLKLPRDLANGLIITLLKNIGRDASTNVSIVGG